ncbi:hypothetical protein [Lysinibacillus capsici]|uniref:hypothetical protein n=1 Tax=Lysinibacillus capsici TaxID=2115968 RepID=UPI000E1FBC2A|nr:hypothetical protein [Lysinibacillus capsici]RDV35227.1 hypothetical protein C7B89_01525 [Lysinibacillus capsici]
MLKKEHFIQNKLNSNSEETQLEDTFQAEEKQVVTIREVVSLLNENETIEHVAQKLEMRTNVLASKLANAAVKLNEESKWVYLGENENESLARNIYKKIYVKPYDQKYVQSSENVENDRENEKVADLDYELYKDSLNVKATVDKKSVLFEEKLYEELKELSQKKSIKVSNLINTLIKKGLNYYDLR